jgi:sporulation protein YqfC
MSKNEKKKRRLLAELPPMTGAPCIELSGNREAVIEGSKGVLEYSTECVRVNTGGMVVTLSGRELDLRCISSSSLIIRGFITGLEFAV